MKKETTHNVLIIGAGPIGLACGIEAQKRKIRHQIIEKGCIVNSIFNYPANMTFFSTADRLEIGEVPFISHGPKATRREALEYYRRVTEFWKLNINMYEKVLDIEPVDTQYKTITDKGKYFSDSVIVASGYYDTPNLMGILGEDLPKVRHYYDEPHKYAFQKLAVIGAGNSAVDVALETFRAGAEVTMIVLETELSPNIKAWVRPDIENRIKEGSIKIFYDSTVKRIRETEIDVQTPNGPLTLKNDFVLAMTGYRPDFEFLERIGIEINDENSRAPKFKTKTHESNMTNVFVAGVVCGGMQTNKWFIENSRSHAKKIFDHIQSKIVRAQAGS